MKQFSKKISELSNMLSQVLESVQPIMSEFVNAHGRKMFEHLGNIVFKHLNSSLDLLHAKSNIFNTNLKQFVEVQSQQSTLVFNPNGKTIARSIRGVANTCASFVEKKQLQPENHSDSLWK